MAARTCPACRQPIAPGTRERNPRKWCSDRCRVWALRHPGQVRPAAGACLSCGSSLELRPAGAKFCSRRCSEVARGLRLAAPLPERVCGLPGCSQRFRPATERQRCCSEQHGKRLYNRESRADGRQVAPAWSDARRDRYHRRRALIASASTGEPVLLAEIAERDGWRCGICERPVDTKERWPAPGSPSLDHVVPLSKGGAHDPSNVRLAHVRCNSARGNRTVSEVRDVG